MSNHLLEVETNGVWLEGLKTSISIRQFEPFLVDEPTSLGGTDEGANPVEYVLAGLSSCTSIMIALIAKEINFTYTSVEFRNKGLIDLRGLSGVEGVSPHFQSVDFDILLKTDESEERVSLLKEKVEKRCPVMNLFFDAGVKVNANWLRV